MNKARLLACMLPAVLSMSSTFVVSTVVTAAIAVQSSAVYAADKKPKQPTVRKEIGKPLQEAQELVKAKKIKEAKALYQQAMAVPDKTAYESWMLAEFGAYLALNSKDYAGAAKAYEATLAGSDLPASQRPQRIKVLAQLYYSLKNYAKASQFANQYLTEVGPNDDMTTIVLQSFYLQGDYQKAITQLNKIIAGSKKPSEAHLQMLLSCYYKLKNTPKIEDTLQLLVSNYPKTDYWKNIFGYVDATKGGTDRTEFEAYRLKQAVGVMDSDEYVQMAELAMAVGVPGDARTILKQGVAAGFVGKGQNKAREDRLMNLANTQSSADEADLVTQSKQAAASAKGDLQAKIGEAYMSYGNYSAAITNLEQALKKGGITSPDLAQLHLGIAELKAGQKADAIKSFKAVPASSKFNKLATLWIVYANTAK